MEGMKREIGSSEIPFIQCNERQLPRDHLRLKIHSNDTYSRALHPNNNCYSFMIEFEQPAAESLQHRINQCNRYQVLSIQLTIRSSLGLIYNSPHHHHHAKNIKKLPLLAAPVVKKFNATIQHPPMTSHFIKSALGNTTYDTHEELHSLQMAIRCNSFGEHFQQSAYENVYNKKTPPSLIDNELIHQATLLYSATEHSSSSNNSYTNQPYSTYPSSTSQLSTALSAYPQIITPTSSHLSALHIDFYPNSSTSTYDKYLPDKPIRLETNITVVFYKEDDHISA